MVPRNLGWGALRDLFAVPDDGLAVDEDDPILSILWENCLKVFLTFAEVVLVFSDPVVAPS